MELANGVTQIDKSHRGETRDVEQKTDKQIKNGKTQQLFRNVYQSRNGDFGNTEEMPFCNVGDRHEQHKGTGGNYGLSQRSIPEKSGSNHVRRQHHHEAEKNRPQKTEDSGHLHRPVHGSGISEMLIPGRNLGDSDYKPFGHKGKKQTVNRRYEGKGSQAFSSQNP